MRDDGASSTKLTNAKAEAKTAQPSDAAVMPATVIEPGWEAVEGGLLGAPNTPSLMAKRAIAKSLALKAALSTKPKTSSPLKSSMSADLTISPVRSKSQLRQDAPTPVMGSG
ncbi:hypothetical protein BAUCODRAFT_147106 [Baudoinia panamericana UAMH 10762]|uniref:Uncharacterized protein n=1 Tax=Baudoinia panamericana (strain UAMH 10762) TaxID=717646 RepID=M2LR46_BAUPA|nr:uncharacterized protein BAUCODRAFT_147106 [Baudoinia panamericana UAMH 10762]EMC96907.1 hypothetical protein BAUCODRAFT_147106 [Baudoinia panamericana UAMH 10762]